MPYVSKTKLIEKPISGQMSVKNLMKEYIDGCSRKKIEYGPVYRNVNIPFSNGSVDISPGPWYKDATVIQAQFSQDKKQITDFLKMTALEYGKRRANQENYSRNRRTLEANEVDNFALSFEKDVDMSELFGDKQDTIAKVPLTMQILPGILKKDDANSEIEITLFDDNPQFVRQIALNTQEMEKINAEYMAKKGIDSEIYGQALLMAETAKKELGFDYKKIKGDCVSLVCSCPQQVSHEKLIPQLLEDMSKGSFRELGINLADLLDAEITLPPKDNYNIKMETALPVGRRYTNSNYIFYKNDKDMFFLEFFNFLNPEIKEGSEIAYSMFEPSSMALAAKNIGRAAKKIIPPAALVAGAGWIVYEGGKAAYAYIPSHADDAVIGTAALTSLYLGYKGFGRLCKLYNYAAEKTKDSPILHPLKAREKKMREETELLKGHFKKLGIKSNITRGPSCLFQYDEKKCLEIERGESK